MLGLTYMSTSLAQSGDPLEDLKVCAKMADAEERMGHKMQIEGDDSRVRVTRIR